MTEKFCVCTLVIFTQKKLFQVGTDCTNSFLEIDNQRHCGTFFTDADMEAAAASVTGTFFTNFSF